MASSRNWCLTLNNPTPEDDGIMRKICKDFGKYGVLGYEVGEQGTPHIQGYIEFKNAQTLAQLKKKHDRCHWEKRRGSQEEARDYCLKDGNYWESAEFEKNQPGRRTDIELTRNLVKQGATMKQICEVASSYQSIRTAEVLYKYMEVKRDWKPSVYWFWGATGTGKTRQAYEMVPDAYTSMANVKWWDGYSGDANVIIDDLRPHDMPFNVLLRLLDRYPYRVECKGGSREFLAKTIIVTSPMHPEKFSNEEDVKQLLRRIDEIKEFKTEVVGTTTTEVRGNTIPGPITN